MTTNDDTRTRDVRISKRLSWLLRHGAAEAEVAQDAAGFIAIDDVLRVVRCSREALERVVRENAKRRFEIVEERIRAVQGHSSKLVDIDALETSYVRYEGPEVILHGTSVRAARAIVCEGIAPMTRTHVHFTPHADSIVGKRAAVDLFIEVSVASLAREGIGVFVAPNGVLLARRVPRACIVGVRPAREGLRAEASAIGAILARG